MEIKFYGKCCFSISDKNATILTDPYTEEGISANIPSANIITYSKGIGKEVKKIQNDAHVLDWPGEYETNGVYIQSIETGSGKNKNCIYTMRIDGSNICHLGHLTDKLDDETLEKIGNIDMLFVPVGNAETLDAKKALDVIDQIDPRVVIPMNYQTDDSEDTLSPVESFLEVMGKKEVEKLPKLSISKSAMSEDRTELFVLNKVE